MFSFFKNTASEPEDPSRREFLKTAAQTTIGGGLLLAGLESEAASFTLPIMEDNRKIDNISLFTSAKDLEASYKKKLYEKAGEFEYYEPYLKGEKSPFFAERLKKPGHVLVEGVPIFPDKGEEVRKIPRDMGFLGSVKGGQGYGVLKAGTKVITIDGGNRVTHIAECANPVSVGGLVKCEVLQQNPTK